VSHTIAVTSAASACTAQTEERKESSADSLTFPRPLPPRPEPGSSHSYACDVGFPALLTVRSDGSSLSVAYPGSSTLGGPYTYPYYSQTPSVITFAADGQYLMFSIGVLAGESTVQMTETVPSASYANTETCTLKGTNL
jgi:hypothetical protein